MSSLPSSNSNKPEQKVIKANENVDDTNRHGFDTYKYLYRNITRDTTDSEENLVPNDKKANETTEEDEANKENKDTGSPYKSFQTGNSKNHFQTLNAKNERIEEHYSPDQLLSHSTFLETAPNTTSVSPFPIQFPSILPPSASVTGVTGFTRDWLTPNNPCCGCDRIEIPTSDTCDCPIFEDDLNWYEACSESMNCSKIHAFYNNKRKELQQEMECMKEQMKEWDEKLIECMRQKDLEMAGLQDMIKSAWDLCCQVHQIECESHEIKTQICGCWQVCNEIDCGNSCCRRVIKSITKLQFDLNKVRRTAMLKSSYLQKCRDSKCRIKIGNRVLKNDIKKLIEIAKEYAKNIESITNEISTYPDPKCPTAVPLLPSGPSASPSPLLQPVPPTTSSDSQPPTTPPGTSDDSPPISDSPSTPTRPPSPPSPPITSSDSHTRPSSPPCTPSTPSTPSSPPLPPSPPSTSSDSQTPHSSPPCTPSTPSTPSSPPPPPPSPPSLQIGTSQGAPDGIFHNTMTLVSNRISTTEARTPETPESNYEQEQKHQDYDRNDKNPGGGSSARRRNSSVSHQSSKSQNRQKDSKSSGVRGRLSGGNAKSQRGKQQQTLQEAYQLNINDYSTLYRITDKANKLIARGSDYLQSTSSGKYFIINQSYSPDEMGIQQEDRKSTKTDINNNFKLSPQSLESIEEDSSSREYFENFHESFIFTKTLDNNSITNSSSEIKDIPQDNSRELLRELKQYRQQPKQSELEYKTFLAGNELLRNDSLDNTERLHQSAKYSDYIETIGNLKAEISNLSRHNENNRKKYFDCRNKLQECQCFLGRCIDEMKKCSDGPEIRRPSKTAGIQKWIDYSNILFDTIKVTKLDLVRNIFVLETVQDERDQLKRECNQTRKKLQYSERRIHELVYQYTGEPLQYQIDALKKENANLRILMENYETSKQQLIRKNEEISKKYEDLEAKWQRYVPQIEQLFGSDGNGNPMEELSELKKRNLVLNSELDERNRGARMLASELRNSQQTVNDLKLKLEKYKINLSESNLVNKELIQASNHTLNRTLQHKQTDPLNSEIANSFRFQIDQQASDIRQMQILYQALRNEIRSNIESIVTNPENENIARELQKINQSFDWIKKNMKKSIDKMEQLNSGPKGIRKQDSQLHEIYKQIASQGQGILDGKNLAYLHDAIYKTGINYLQQRTRSNRAFSKTSFHSSPTLKTRSEISKGISQTTSFGVEKLEQLEKDMEKTKNIIKYLRRKN